MSSIFGPPTPTQKEKVRGGKKSMSGLAVIYQCLSLPDGTFGLASATNSALRDVQRRWNYHMSSGTILAHKFVRLASFKSPVGRSSLPHST